MAVEVTERGLRRMDASGICVVTWLSKRSAGTKSSVTSVRMAKSASMRVVKPCDDGWRPCTFSFAKALASLRASALACCVVAATGMLQIDAPLSVSEGRGNAWTRNLKREARG